MFTYVWLLYVLYEIVLAIIIVCDLITVEVQTVITVPKDFDLESLLG